MRWAIANSISGRKFAALQLMSFALEIHFRGICVSTSLYFTVSLPRELLIFSACIWALSKMSIYLYNINILQLVKRNLYLWIVRFHLGQSIKRVCNQTFFDLMSFDQTLIRLKEFRPNEFSTKRVSTKWAFDQTSFDYTSCRLNEFRRNVSRRNECRRNVIRLNERIPESIALDAVAPKELRYRIQLSFGRRKHLQIFPRKLNRRYALFI